MTNIEIKFAETDEEKSALYKLRYEAFDFGTTPNRNNGDGEQSGSLEDIDKFDQDCSHIIAIQKETGQIIGTYRLQNSASAQKGNGFCSQILYELKDLGELVLKDSVELSRACIHKDYRRGRVLFILWEKIIEYCFLEKKRYLFGSCSFPGANPKKACQMYSYIKEQNHYHSKYNVRVKEESKVSSLQHYSHFQPDSLPPLFGAYIKNGCKICSEPALDFDFNSFDFFMLLDLEQKPASKTISRIKRKVQENQSK